MSLSQNWSVSSVVRRLIELDPAIIAGLSARYVNLSSLARLLRPQVEGILKRPVSVDAIISSLKRMRSRPDELSFPVARVIAESRLNLKSDLAKLSVKRTLKTRGIVKEVAYRYRKTFLQALEGISSITLIHDEKLHPRLKKYFPRQYIIDESSGLVALIIVSPAEITSTPGPLALILNRLVERGINVEEIISCNTDTVVVVRAMDGGRAFDSINELIQTCRQVIGSKGGRVINNRSRD